MTRTRITQGRIRGEGRVLRQDADLWKALVRILPNAASCLRLVRALSAEMHENRIEATRYLNMEPLREQENEARRRLGEVA